jgi:hypothetical protein
MPIKRNDNLVPLSKTTTFTLLFCWKIRTGLKLKIETDANETLCAILLAKRTYSRNFHEEETILFVPIPDAAVTKKH